MKKDRLLPSQVAQIRARPGNAHCVECSAQAPQWAAVSHGALICVGCAGLHRSLGVHISFVKALELDLWTSDEAACLALNGNRAWDLYCSTHGLTAAAMRRYDTPHAAHYKAVAAARAASRTPPPFPSDSLPLKWVDPHAGESTAQRSAREMGEAKARMATRIGGTGAPVIAGSGRGDGGLVARFAKLGSGIGSALRRRMGKETGGAPAAAAPPLVPPPSWKAFYAAEQQKKRDAAPAVLRSEAAPPAAPAPAPAPAAVDLLGLDVDATWGGGAEQCAAEAVEQKAAEWRAFLSTELRKEEDAAAAIAAEVRAALPVDSGVVDRNVPSSSTRYVPRTSFEDEL